MYSKRFLFLLFLIFLWSCSSKRSGYKNTPNCKDIKRVVHGDIQELNDRISANACWNNQKIKLNISWRDDITDAIPIPLSERRWKDPEKKLRDKDKMYFYDNLGIRIYANDQFYEGWIMPKKDSLKIQWQNYGSIAVRKSERTTALKLKLLDRSNSHLQFKASLDFNKIKFTIKDSTKIKLVLILVDSDANASVKMKERVHSSNYFVLEEILTSNTSHYVN